MKKAILFAISVFVVSPSYVYAGFFDDLLDKAVSVVDQAMPGVSNLVNATGGADVDVLLTLVNTADATFKKSIDVLFNILAAEEDKVKIEMELKTANEILDPKEKDAKIQEIEVEKEAVVKKAANQENCDERCRALNRKQKALYAKSVYNILLAAKYDWYAFQQGRSITQKCTNSPVSCAGIALKLPELADILTTLPNQAQNITDFGATLSKIGSAANIEIQQPQSEKEEPNEVEIG